MARVGEPLAAGDRTGRYGLRVPVDTLLGEHLFAQQPEQHIVGRLVLGMQLEALALEILDVAAVFSQRVADRVAENTEPPFCCQNSRKRPSTQ